MSDSAPVRWGILGTGMIAKQVVNKVKASPELRIAAVGSRERGRAEAFVKEQALPGAKAHGSYEEFLADREVEAVYLTLPNSLHAEWTLRAARAGKHVLCEKPLAAGAAEAREMADGCRRAGVLLMEAFMYRCHPQTHRILEAVRSGVIGELRHIRSCLCFTVTDLRNVRLSAPLAGGSLMDVGCYCVNFSRYVAGTEPLEASALAEFGAESRVDEVFCGTLRFPGGVLAQFHTSMRSCGFAGAEISGTKGRIRVENPWKPPADETAFDILAGKDTRKVVIENGGEVFRLQFEAFGRAVRQAGALPLPPQDAVSNMAVLEALLRSAREGASVKLA